jgi:hypothetical protein
MADRLTGRDMFIEISIPYDEFRIGKERATAILRCVSRHQNPDNYTQYFGLTHNKSRNP